MTPITQRQRRIAELAALGHTNGEIAARLDVALVVVRAELEALHRRQRPQAPHRPTREEDAR